MSIENMTAELQRLRDVIAAKDAEIKHLNSKLSTHLCNSEVSNNGVPFKVYENLAATDITRYSRQLILPEIGTKGQIALKNASVLIVGAGGLGCPVGMYLSAAGIGKIGIVDHDIVDVNNLHRQIAHTEKSVGILKCASFMNSVKAINSSLVCEMYPILLNSGTVKDIIPKYDIIVDASDNVPTRYLLNDAAVLYGKPLVSGAALKFEGQLTVYNFQGGPCYRCIFPQPPPASAVTNCSEGGVLGAVTGIIGSFQALEVIKIIVGLNPSYHKKMLIFDGLTGDIRIINVRNKKLDCKLCGKQPEIKEPIDYELFCGTAATDKDADLKLLEDKDRITCSEYKQLKENQIPHILIDVRPSNEMDICQLPGSVNIPFPRITQENSISLLENLIKQKNCQKSYVVCRRGNDSQKAVIMLQKIIKSCAWKDIVGGLHAWHKEIDPNFPLY
ncbi:adenylyltransferase and sulfurtransferase MOCS3-like [Uloborus diversus]|uniref:adenylyltransferase and sulfurtransferase MOCS3-like n=1 Tax=Uloborus diversus TaxID=327109 RepID=UPI002409ABC3|nr:adenylyltransferase and sulfurtransferase MOCS3-like [Uloborus diversus]